MQYKNSHNDVLCNEQGGPIVEFAIVLPFLFLIIFGIIQYAFIFWTYIVVSNGTSIAARHVGLINPAATNAELLNITRSSIGSMLGGFYDSTGLTTTTGNVIINGSAATSVQVSYAMPLMFPFVVPQSTPGNSFNLTSSMVIR